LQFATGTIVAIMSCYEVKSKLKSLSRKRDLRTGTPLWLKKPAPRVALTPITQAVPADVVVVGSGISGALVADALQHGGLRVLVVDRRQPMTGSTPASTALLQFETDTPLLELTRRIGHSRAARAWWRSAQAVLALQGRIADLDLVCDFVPRDTLYLPGNILRVNELRLEAEARRRLGLRSEFVNSAKLKAASGIARPGAILSRGNGELDPVKLLSGLWRNFIRCGGQMSAKVEVTEFEESRSSVRLKTRDGHSIHAKHVVFCTGYEIPKSFRPPGYKVISTWVMATKPQKRKPWRGNSLIWEAADPYIYLRTTRDGRVIAGGEDEPFSDAERRDALIPRKIAAIATKAARLFPHLDFTPAFSWAGCFGESPTGLPAIGPLPGYNRVQAVMGFGGNGITFSMIAAQIASRTILGLRDPDAEIFGLTP
jgi:glycine/D-amino acid oxidase-like deaminating enzyme